MDMNIGQNFRKIRENLGLEILDVSVETGERQEKTKL